MLAQQAVRVSSTRWSEERKQEPRSQSVFSNGSCITSEAGENFLLLPNLPTTRKIDRSSRTKLFGTVLCNCGAWCPR